MKLVWDEPAWDDYRWWQAQDRKVLHRTNTLIQDIVRNGNEGIGKPEALRHEHVPQADPAAIPPLRKSRRSSKSVSQIVNTVIADCPASEPSCARMTR